MAIENNHDKMMKYILSVDGGGIRGIIPAMVLAEIERKAMKPIAEMFDLMAGTSTGAIAVAGLSKKGPNGSPRYSADDLVQLYLEHGRHIFKTSFLRRTLSWFNDAQYPHDYIESTLERYFGDDPLRNSLCHLLITSYDIENHSPYFLKSWKEDRNFLKVSDALRMTTAAPTYFEPKRLKIGQTERVLIDGGVFANNPSACAYANGKSLFPGQDFTILSIGTGRVNRRITNSKRLGKIAWLKPLLNIMFTSGLDSIDYQMTRVMGDRYLRIQGLLKVASSKLDNVEPKNIERLQEEAKAIIEDNRETINKFCERNLKLTENKEN